MTSQITNRRTATGTHRRTIWQWAADTTWERAARSRTYPVIPDTIRGTRRELAAYVQNNKTLHSHTQPLMIGEYADGQPMYAMHVTRADMRHPIRNPRIVKARRTARRAATLSAVTGGITGTCWAVQAVWGHAIADALRIIGGAALTVLLAAVGILIVRSFAVGHPCPGLHCPNCGGGH